MTNPEHPTPAPPRPIISVIDVGCPFCNSAPGDVCRHHDGTDRAQPHHVREMTFQFVTRPEPSPESKAPPIDLMQALREEIAARAAPPLGEAMTGDHWQKIAKTRADALARVYGVSHFAGERTDIDGLIAHIALAASRLSALQAEKRSWKQLAMQAMRYLNADQIVAVTKAAGVSATICRDDDLCTQSEARPG